jgi:hypothetical protein
MLDVVASFNEEEQNTLLCCFHCVLLPLQMNFSMYSLLIAFLLVASSASFVPQRNLNVCRSTRLHKTTDDFQSDFPPEEEAYKGDVDWDAEWKKVLANKDQPKERPGKDFYKSEAEIKAIKVANKASEKVVKVASSIPSLPSFDSVKNDWKFWVGILAVVSIAFSLISASGQPAQMASGGDSFYI